MRKHIKICSRHDQAAAAARPPLPCAQEEPACIGEHERPGLGEKEASGDLAPRTALHGYDPSFLEDAENFVRSLNTEPEVPSRHAAGQESDPASFAPSAPQPPHQLLLLSRPDGSSDRQPAGQGEDEARRHLARMIALHGYDPSVVEDDYFRSFVRSLNSGFEVPSRVAIEMCDGIFDGRREDLFSRIRRVPGKVSLSVGTFRTIEGEVLYTACHFIDDQWNLHRVTMDAYVDGYCLLDYYGPLLGVHQVPFSLADSREDCIEKVVDGFSQRDVLDNMFMMLWETTGDDGIHLRNQIEECKSNANPTRTLISTTFMDEVIHSVARYLTVDTDFDYEIISDLDDLHLTRQKRQNILSELGLDYNLGAYGEDWYWTYCSLQVLRKEGSTRTGTGSEFAELLCKLYGEIYRAIRRISASSCPTSNICLVELFKLRQLLQTQVTEASGDRAAAYELCNCFLGDGDVADVLKEPMNALDRSIIDSYHIWPIPLILDPRYKLEYIEFLFQGAFVDSEATSCISEVKRQIKMLYAEYGAMTNNANPDLVTEMAACSSADPLQEAWEEHRRLRSHQDAETELNRYLKDCLTPQTESFDILKWWKDNSRNYPTVARMARDALAMPTCSKLSSEQMAHVRSILRGYSKAAFQALP